MTVVERDVSSSMVISRRVKTVPAQKGKSKGKRAPLSFIDKVPAEDVEFLFSYWIEMHGRARAKLDDNRRAYLARGINQYGVAACMEAIKGCSLSDWHMGHNPGSKMYNSIELIFRDAEHTERFIDIDGGG